MLHASVQYLAVLPLELQQGFSGLHVEAVLEVN